MKCLIRLVLVLLIALAFVGCRKKLPAPAVLWTNDEVGITTSPALGLVAGKAVICVVSGPGVWAINADGTTRWKWESEPMSAHNGPSTNADGSRLYVADDNKGVICFDVATGAILWQLAEQYGDCTPVVGPDSAIYVTSLDAVTRIRDFGDTAAVEWTAASPHQSTNVVLGANGVIYGISYGDFELGAAQVFALDSGGRLLWQDTSHVTGDYGGLMTCPALDSRGRLLIASGCDSLICFSPDGSVAWSAETPDLYGGGITVGYGDRIYVQSCDEGSLYCLDSNGRMKWTREMEETGILNNVCALADSSILLADCEEYVDCRDRNGLVRWSFCITDSLDLVRRPRPSVLEGDDSPTPLVGPDGRIYVGYGDGLCCLTVGGVPLANTAWPTYNHDNAHSGWAGRP
jgi:outer membrane protein assembly factor BamB